MSGMIIIGIGIAMIVLAVVLFITAAIYRSTTGKRIRNELGKEYE